MLIEKKYIEQYIPQRAPFVMIDNLIEASDNKFISDFYISNENIFIEDGILNEYALIENIAQTSSVGILLKLKKENQKFTDGYIGGIIKLFVINLPKSTQTIRTEVEILSSFSNLYLIKGVSYIDEDKIFECEIKLAGVNTNKKIEK